MTKGQWSVIDGREGGYDNPMSDTPMGRLDAIDVGDRKLTVQTEYFARPNARLETKVYLGGALKKVFTEELAEGDDVQALLHRVHEKRMQEIVAGLRGIQSR